MQTPRSVHDLVEQQVQRWMAEQQRRHERAFPEPPPPVVTVSREAGVNGTGLARRVADELGFRCWDQELVHRVAEQSGAPEVLLRAVDEHARNAIEDLLAGILMGDKSTETEYLAQLMRVIHAISEHGSAVIVGRGAQYVLAPEGALRVRVVAPLEARVRMMAAARKLPEDRARAEVERLDRERHGFIRHHYHRDAADPSSYDLVVNAATLPLEAAAHVVASAYRAKFPGRGRA